jgi:peptidoglycan/LPS O-acetylase OafA/YrhL
LTNPSPVSKGWFCFSARAARQAWRNALCRQSPRKTSQTPPRSYPNNTVASTYDILYLVEPNGDDVQSSVKRNRGAERRDKSQLKASFHEFGPQGHPGHNTRAADEEKPALVYRRDIDGLRAIAILLVVAYHAAPSILRGGFVGVDVFFVVSGFLISSILLEEHRNGGVALVRFYARRIRRLFPALLVVLATTAIAGWFYLLPHEFRQLGVLISSGSAYAINFELRSEAGYFDIAAIQKPLLHLWSLAIEEQFYLIYPILLVIVLRFGARWAFTILFAATVLSLGSEVRESANASVAAFYLPQYRAWELCAGGLLAFAELYGAGSIFGVEAARLARSLDSPFLRDAMSIAGIVLILAAATGLNAHAVYPSPLPLVACLGAFLTIAAGVDAVVNRMVLSSAAMVGVGLISYPLYLWHWPLISFLNILGAESELTRAAAVLAAFALAVVTYLAIEKPSRRLSNRRLAPALFGGMCVSALIGLAVSASIIPPRLNDAQMRDLSDASQDFEYPRGLKRDRMPSGRKINTAGVGDERILFFGDSNIEQYWPRVERLLDTEGVRKSVIFVTAGGCPPLPSGPLPRCPGFADDAKATAENMRVSRVVIGADWLYYLTLNGIADQFDKLREEVRWFRNRGISVWIISNIPTGAELSPLSWVTDRTWSGEISIQPQYFDRARFEKTWSPMRAQLLAIAKETASSFIDPMDWLCDQATCPALDANNRFIYRDAQHLRSSFVRDQATFIDQTVR